MSNQHTPREHDNNCNCDCNPAQITWKYGESWYDEHQHVIPGTCQCCGTDLEYVYTEAGIRTTTNVYKHEF